MDVMQVVIHLYMFVRSIIRYVPQYTSNSKYFKLFSIKTRPIQLVCNTSYFQESCVRTLLFRGADKEALNYAGQTAYQVAVIAGNLELAEVIKNHRSEDIGKICILL